MVPEKTNTHNTRFPGVEPPTNEAQGMEAIWGAPFIRRLIYFDLDRWSIYNVRVDSLHRNNKYFRGKKYRNSRPPGTRPEHGRGCSRQSREGWVKWGADRKQRTDWLTPLRAIVAQKLRIIRSKNIYFDCSQPTSTNIMYVLGCAMKTWGMSTHGTS